MILFDILSLDGYEVILADDGDSGIERFNKDKPDLVITGILMPKMDGLEVVERLKEISPGSPMIVASGTTDLNLIEEAVHKHANRILKKLFIVDQLPDSVAELIGDGMHRPEKSFSHHHYPVAT
jgi:DNA-binding NtrC family response regulator